jgi:hypothetical protein
MGAQFWVATEGIEKPMVRDEQWALLAPLIKACRPAHKTEHRGGAMEDQPFIRVGDARCVGRGPRRLLAQDPALAAHHQALFDGIGLTQSMRFALPALPRRRYGVRALAVRPTVAAWSGES